MILCCGETLIDFLPVESGEGPAYRPVNGGSVHNVAVALARLGVPVALAGGISTDLFGDQLMQGLQANGVSTTFVTRLRRPTTLAFVRVEGGEPRYAFYDAEAADRHWLLEEMPAPGDDIQALHFGGISLIRHPAAAAYETLMLRERGRRLIGFDANIRPGLVGDEADYRRRLTRFLQSAHVIKVSDADLAWLAPGSDPAAVAAGWLDHAARIVLLTRGAQGATLLTRQRAVTRPALPVAVADTVGAGDAFMAGALAALHDAGALEPAAAGALDGARSAELLEFALAVAAVACSRRGADPPRRADLQPLLAPPA